MGKYDRKLSAEEKILADRVADEILTVYEEKDDKRYFFLILLFLLCLIFLVSSISFAVFETYYNGSDSNVIDVKVNIDEDDKDKDEDEDKDKDDDKEETDDNSQSDNNYKPSIDPASVIFSFNEGSNYINMNNVFPTSDDVGMSLSGDKEYFDFNISSKIKGNNKGKLIYEIAIVPVAGNTIDESDVRVYLTENSKGVSILDNKVNSFSSLPDSNLHNGAKVIYKKSVSNHYNANYVFRMWLSSEANVSKVAKKFACKIIVDAYYK